MREHRLHTFWPFNHPLERERRMIFAEGSELDAELEEQVTGNDAAEKTDVSAKMDRAERVDNLLKALEKVENGSGEKLKEQIKVLVGKDEQEVQHFADRFYREVASHIAAINEKLSNNINLEELNELLPSSTEDLFFLAVNVAGMTQDEIFNAMAARKEAAARAAQKQSSRPTAKRKKKKQKEEWQEKLADWKSRKRKWERALEEPEDWPVDTDDKKAVEAHKRLKQVIDEIQATDREISRAIMAKRRMRRTPMAMRDWSGVGAANEQQAGGYRQLALLKEEYEELTGESWRERKTREYLVREQRRKEEPWHALAGGEETWDRMQATRKAWQEEQDIEKEKRQLRIEQGRIIPRERGESYAVYQERLEYMRKQKQREERLDTLLGTSGGFEHFGTKAVGLPQYSVGYTPQQWETLQRYDIPPPPGVHFVSNRPSGDSRQMHRGAFGRSYEIDQLPSEDEIRATNDRIIARNRPWQESRQMEILGKGSAMFRKHPDFLRMYNQLLETRSKTYETDPDGGMWQFNQQFALLENCFTSMTRAQEKIREMNVPQNHPTVTITLPLPLQGQGNVASERTVPIRYSFSYGKSNEIKTITADDILSSPTERRPFPSLDEARLGELERNGIVLEPRYRAFSNDRDGAYPKLAMSSIVVHFVKDGVYFVPGEGGRERMVKVEGGTITSDEPLSGYETAELHRQKIEKPDTSLADLDKTRRNAKVEMSFDVSSVGNKAGRFMMEYPNGQREIVDVPFVNGEVAIYPVGGDRAGDRYRCFFFQERGHPTIRPVSQEGHPCSAVSAQKFKVEKEQERPAEP